MTWKLTFSSMKYKGLHQYPDFKIQLNLVLWAPIAHLSCQHMLGQTHYLPHRRCMLVEAHEWNQPLKMKSTTPLTDVGGVVLALCPWTSCTR